jgi:tRNA(fMet)-specific endonuclease VapC
MRFVLDTDICIYIIKKKPLNVWRKFQELSLGEIGVSTITVAELQYGVYKSQRQAKKKWHYLSFYCL